MALKVSPLVSAPKGTAMSALAGVRAWVNEDDRNKADYLVKVDEIEFTRRKTLAIPTGKSGTKEYTLTEFSYDQYCKWIKIPTTYLQSCPVDGPGGQVAQVRMRMEELKGKTRLIRVRNQEPMDGVSGLVRAILPGTYSVFDHRNLLTAVERAAREMNESFELQATNAQDPKSAERSLHLRLVRKSGFDLETIGVNDPHKIGFHVSCSEVGDDSIKCMALVYRLICKNGMMGWGESDVLSQRNRGFELHEMFPRIHEAIEASVRQEAAVRDLLERSYAEEIEGDPGLHIRRLGMRMKLSDDTLDRVEEVFKSTTRDGSSFTRYQLIQAFTQTAQELPFQERTRLETSVGQTFFGGGGSRGRQRVIDMEVDDA